MEKRKINVVNQLGAIQEEHTAALDNLNILLRQVTCCVDFTRQSNENTKILEILTYELDILKKLTEINLDLEKLTEACPIGFQAVAVNEEPNNADNTITEDIQTSEGVSSELIISPNLSELPTDSNFNDGEKSESDFSTERIDTIHKVDGPDKFLSSTELDTESNFGDEESDSDFTDVIEQSTICKEELSEPPLYDINDEVPVRDLEPKCPPQSTNSALTKLNSYAASKKQLAATITERSIGNPDIELKPVEVADSIIDNSETVKKKKNKKRKKGLSHAVIELRPKKMPTVNDYCSFSHIESPAEFYIHVVDLETGMIDKLEAEISKYFKDSVCPYDNKEMAYNLIRDFGCVYAQNYKSWYRCRIEDWNLNQKTDSVVIQFVDHGNYQLTTYKNLRRMPREFAELPMLAIKCFFPILYPPGSTHMDRKKKWPQETIDALANLSLLYEEKQKHSPFKIEYACEKIEDNSLAVDLFSPNNPDQTIGDILIDLRLVEELPETSDDSNVELEEFTQDIDTLEYARNINEAVQGYDPKDEARICRFSRKNGTCFKGKNCKLEHRKLPKDGFTTDKEDVFNEAMYDLVLPLVDEIVQILITGHKDICNFYVQIIRTVYCDPVNLHKMDLSMHNLLTEMNSEKAIRQYEPYRIKPSLGELVIVYNYWSKQWLRAVFIDLIDEEQNFATVFTVDFGETIKVKLADVRKIKERFLKLPFQAVLCYISGYKPNINRDNKDASDFFFKNMYFRNFVAVIMSSDEPMRIKLQTHSGTDIGDGLLNKGYVDKVSNDTHITDNSILLTY